VKQNPAVYRSAAMEWVIELNHPRKADFVWRGAEALNSFHSNFGCCGGGGKFREPLYFASEEEARSEVEKVVLPWIKENKTFWVEFIKGW
jgi:hypothetical protein